jgi:periplasmic protein TonB
VGYNGRVAEPSSPPGHGAPAKKGSRALVLLLGAALLVLVLTLVAFFGGSGPPPRPEIPPPEPGEGDIVYVAPGEPETYFPPGVPHVDPEGRPPAARRPEIRDDDPAVGEVRPRWPEEERPEPLAPEPPADEPDPGEQIFIPAGPVTPPRLRHLPPPVYPPMARQRGREAAVELRVQVDAQGGVTRVEILSPPAGWGFDEAARRAALQASYEPGQREGRPVPATTRLTIRFVLE